MKILMIPTQNMAIMYWRFATPAAALRRLGHDVTCLNEVDYKAIHEKHQSMWPYLDEVASQYDIIHTGYAQSEEYLKILIAIRHKYSKHIIVDMDDNVDEVPAYNPGFHTFLPASTETRATRLHLRLSDAATTTKQQLQKVVAKYNPTSYILPNLLNLDDWDFPPPPPKGRAVRILFAGGNGRFADLNITREAIEATLRKYDGKEGRPLAQFMFMGATPDWVAPFMPSAINAHSNRVFYINPTTDVKDFQRIAHYLHPDIYFSPTIENSFNACKSNLKALEAAMLGSAFLCTDFDTYDDVPRDTCIKVSNTEVQWTEAFSALIEDASLRQRLSGKAREWALDSQVIDTHIDKWVSAYEKTLSVPPILKEEDLHR